MRCLYCGKELALLKRLTGGGEFCSEAHKHSYREEYNRIALGRLLQAQAKAKSKATQSEEQPLASPVTPVAVHEAVPEPVMQAVTETVEEALAEPAQTAGFLLEKPPVSALPETVPYLEPWLESSQTPAVPEWHFEYDVVSSLSFAELLPLALVPTFGANEPPSPEVSLTPEEFAQAKVNPRVQLSAAASHQLPSGAPIALLVTPSNFESPTQTGWNRAVSFRTTVEFHDSALLELSPSGIAFPAEDADVTVFSKDSVSDWVDELLQPQFNGAVAFPEPAPASAPISAPTSGPASAPASEPPANVLSTLAPPEETKSLSPSPHAALAALSRLHKELVQNEEPRVETVAPPPLEKPPESVAAEPAGVSEEEDQTLPRLAEQLAEIPTKSFAPAKASLEEPGALLRPVSALLPRLSGLPMRPKVALIPPQSVPQSKAVASKTPATAAKSPAAGNTAPTRREIRPKPVEPAYQPQAEQPTMHSQGSKPAPPASKSVQPETAPKLEQPPKLAPVVPVFKPAQAPSAPPQSPLQSPLQSSKIPATVSVSHSKKETPPVESSRPEARVAQPSEPTSKPEAVKLQSAYKPTPSLGREGAVPSFGVPPTSGFLGSLKLKLGIAIIGVAVVCTAYLGWGGKSDKPARASQSSDGAGPSIMVGEGGWVENWAGDPNGARFGRVITIYRPSLTLSDYRIEFQATIDTKSVGWVFRASDPQNYYAMKLASVSGGLAPKMALFKYLVASGRQTQVGRVPLDIAVRPDSIFKVRVDVRGPRFSTYVQGQQVDVWTDDQLKSGGVGFLNEREERSRIKSVAIYLLK